MSRWLLLSNLLCYTNYTPRSFSNNTTPTMRFTGMLAVMAAFGALLVPTVLADCHNDGDACTKEENRGAIHCACQNIFNRVRNKHA